MVLDIEQRLQVDPGRRTLGELLQEREAALQEIRQLRSRIERLTRVVPAPPPAKPVAVKESAPARRAPAADAPPVPRRSFPPGALLRLRDVCELVGVGGSTIYGWRAEGRFPRPIRVGTRAVRWPIEAIEQWRLGLDG